MRDERPLFAELNDDGITVRFTHSHDETVADLDDYKGTGVPLLDLRGAVVPAIVMVQEASEGTFYDWCCRHANPSKYPSLIDYIWMCRHRGVRVSYL